MKNRIRIAIAQMDCTVGDLEGNSRKIIGLIRRSRSLGADIVAFPELAVTGYPPEDLLLKPKFVSDNIDALSKIATYVSDIVAVVGYAGQDPSGIYNSAAVLYKRAVRGTYNKVLLPNYGVFDEKRYFKPGGVPRIFKLGDILFGVTICEDIWHLDGPLSHEASLGAKLIININSSPFHAGKLQEREAIAKRAAKAGRFFVTYANMVGGQDEIVFDGQSMIIDPSGKVIHRAEAFKEDLLVADIEVDSPMPDPLRESVTVSEKLTAKIRPDLPKRRIKSMSSAEEVYSALVLGLKDYAAKNGFGKAVVGLSGGIDSSLVAAIASDALGSGNVTGIFMPTRFSSASSERDARRVADNLAMRFSVFPIEQIYKLYLASMIPHFKGMAADITEENLQARIRGNILMALSNKFGWLVLTTGNKSEMSTGYATLYGDMAGGLAVIKDVPKTLVYKLCRFRNSVSKAIPASVLSKEPTAELRHNQKDSDTLPPYDVLDPIIKAYVEEDKSTDEICALGFPKETVSRTISMVDNSEYKRRQSPPGIKITPKAFGKDRRIPITNKYRQQ